MNHALRFTAAKIAARLELIRPFVFRKSLPLPPFRLKELESAATPPPLDEDDRNWPEIPPQSYWGKADLNFLMRSRITVPPDWNTNELALNLPLGSFGDIFNHPEALVLIDGLPIGSADRYHHTIALDAGIVSGKAHRLHLHGWTGHTQWPPDPLSRAKLFMGCPMLVERDPDLLAFVDLAEAALDACSAMPETPARESLLDALDTAILALDTRAPLGERLYATARDALQILRAEIARAGQPLKTTLHGIGHAHMDIAYLWPISQIRRKNARTYSNVLRLMEANPDYRFSHSQPQLYAYTQRDYPKIFDAIRSRVAEGRWEVMGGMWVEPDLNLPGPEALARQLALGRRYFRETFGDVETPVLWLPDTFGFPGQIPQLMRLAGLKWFCTNKLNWNQVTRVPHTHHWEGIDGSRVLAHVLTTPRDVQYLPFPTNYKSDLSAQEVLGTNARVDAEAENLPICFGYGDGGGGPTEALLARLKAYRAMPGMPQMRFSTVRETFEAITAEARDLPTHKGEHYMEGHRGVLTSQAWIKRANRKNERALHAAEALSAMAGIVPNLEEAWTLLCLNQFHDIITGTSVAEVFEDARRDHARIATLAETARAAAASELALNGASLLNVAPLAADRVIELDAVPPAGMIAQPAGGKHLLFAPALPAYSVSALAEAVAPPPKGLSATLSADGAVMENPFLRIEIDPHGRLTSIFDKETDCEFLEAGGFGNQFQAFEDRPICWDAWDIDPSFEDRTDLIAEPAELRLVEQGPIRAAIEVAFEWRSSRFVQTIRLSAHSRRVDFMTEIDWHETHTLLKTAFPVDIHADEALYDIQWGSIARPTGRQTPHDFARFEVAAQKWALLEDETRGFAILNDCKYGHDVRENVMRLTLVKSSTSPDPNADQGRHLFTYAILPMAPGDRDRLTAEAYALNTPLHIQPAAPQSGARAGRTLFEITGLRLIPESLVPHSQRAFILRLYEPDGGSGRASIAFAQAPVRAEICDILGTIERRLDVDENAVSLDVGPFQIISLLITMRG